MPLSQARVFTTEGQYGIFTYHVCFFTLPFVLDLRLTAPRLEAKLPLASR